MSETAQHVSPRQSHGDSGRAAPSKHEIVLVTGGSRGIGFALAREFAARGHALGLVARHGDALEKAAEQLRREYGVDVYTYPLDLTALNAANCLRAAVQADGLTVKHLINNAGAWLSGGVAASDLAELEHVVTTNALVPLRLTKTFLLHIAAAGGGIINVGSLAGTVPTPDFAAYGASKAFLGALSIAMRQELKERGIPVCIVMPGLVRTGFISTSGTSLWYRLTATTPETVAFAAYRGFLTGQPSVVPGLGARILYFGIRVLPRAVSQGLFNFATAWRQ